jgi:hypothetical protein
MIKLFRHIRQRMILESKVSKYLLYAIGEIILVVIGILIALQINDWSGAQKLKKTNVLLMQKMQEELQINIDRIHYLDTRYAVRGIPSGWTPMLLTSDSALTRLNDGLSEEDMLWMLPHFHFYEGNVYNMSSSVYKEMLSTGRFYTLGSDSLINRIRLYYQRLEREDDYVVQWNEQADLAWRECKYGYNDLKKDFDRIGRTALDDHPWYLDHRSTQFIDLKAALYESSRSTERNRRHAMTMLQESETLIKALQGEIQSMK